MSIEEVILNNLATNENYTRKVIPFLKNDYFDDIKHRTIFTLLDQYISKYNQIPSKEALLIELDNVKTISQETFKDCKIFFEGVYIDSTTQIEWLEEKTEKFCQEKAVYNAIMKSIQILDDKTAKESKGSIPEILSNALAVSFDTHVGHDFLEDYISRYDFYHKLEERLPFDLSFFNKITRGGLPKKTLNVIMAGVGVGKSLFMCHMAASNLLNSKNVLYITMEMAEERIAERIDANLLDISLDELATIPKEIFEKRLNRVKTKTTGKLIIKEYPTSQAGSAHFRHLLTELKLKKNFKPDIIYIDYLNICMSSRLKMGSNVNSYTYVRSIAEEIRGLAIEWNIPIVTATQVNREGFGSSDFGLENTSESFGLPALADMMFGIISNEELRELNQVLVKQLKNRYSDLGLCSKFVVGIDRAKMKLYDLEDSAQENILNGPSFKVKTLPDYDKPAMDNGDFFTKDKERSIKKVKFDKNKLKDFK